MPAAAGGDFGDAGVDAAADGSVETEETVVRDKGSGIRESEDAARRERGGAEMTWESFYLICFLSSFSSLKE